MTGKIKCKLKLKEITSRALCEFLGVKSQTAENFSHTKKSNTLKSPAVSDSERKQQLSKEKEKEIKWRRDIRF